MAEPLPPLFCQPSQPSPEEDDEDQKKNASRGKSCSACEDFLIAKSWVGVSEDNRNGVGNNVEVFHDRLKQFAHSPSTMRMQPPLTATSGRSQSEMGNSSSAAGTMSSSQHVPNG